MTPLLCLIFLLTALASCAVTDDLAFLLRMNDGTGGGVATWSCANSHAPFSDYREAHSCVSFKGQVWLAAGRAKWISGQTNDLWFTSDGTTWSCANPSASFKPRSDFLMLATETLMWIIGGHAIDDDFLNDVHFSGDGTNWQSATTNASFGSRRKLTGAFYRGALWVIGGQGSDFSSLTDVWHSTDGVEWHCATTNAFSGPFYAHQCVVFRDRIWVIGCTGPASGNYLWSSADGTNWESSGVAPFATHDDYPMVVYRNRMRILGGSVPSMTTGTNDIWSTRDGTNWTLETPAASFAPRILHSAVTHGQAIYLIGGRFFNDVWIYTGE